jgi:hypothetical protein
MRQVLWLLAGAAIAALFMDWVHLRVEAASARSRVERCIQVSDVKTELVDSCISSLALCAGQDEKREAVFKAYMSAGARAQEREADQQRADLQILRARHAK